MIIKYCKNCGERIPAEDFKTGRAAIYKNASYCEECKNKVVPKEEVEKNKILADKESIPQTEILENPSPRSKLRKDIRKRTTPGRRPKTKRFTSKSKGIYNLFRYPFVVRILFLVPVFISIFIIVILNLYNENKDGSNSKILPSEYGSPEDTKEQKPIYDPEDEYKGLQIDIAALKTEKLYKQALNRLHRIPIKDDKLYKERVSLEKEIIDEIKMNAEPLGKIFLFCDFSRNKWNLKVDYYDCTVAKSDTDSYLNFIRGNVSTLRAYFLLKEVPKRLILKVNHKSLISSEEPYSYITIKINGIIIAQKLEVSRAISTQDWDIAPYCRCGRNIILWRLGDTKNHYYLKLFEIFEL